MAYVYFTPELELNISKVLIYRQMSINGIKHNI